MTPVSITETLIPVPLYPNAHTCGALIFSTPQAVLAASALTVPAPIGSSSACTLKFGIISATSSRRASSSITSGVASSPIAFTIHNGWIFFALSGPFSLSARLMSCWLCCDCSFKALTVSRRCCFLSLLSLLLLSFISGGWYCSFIITITKIASSLLFDKDIAICLDSSGCIVWSSAGAAAITTD